MLILMQFPAFRPRRRRTIFLTFLPAVMLGTLTFQGTRSSTVARADTPPAKPPTATTTTPAKPQTWEEYLAQRAQQRRLVLKGFLNSRGYKDPEFQTTLADFMQQRDADRRKLIDASHNLMAAVPQDSNAADAQTRLDAYQKALTTFTQDRAAAEKALDGKLGYSKNPRLQALLFTLGALEASPVSAGIWPADIS